MIRQVALSAALLAIMAGCSCNQDDPSSNTSAAPSPSAKTNDTQVVTPSLSSAATPTGEDAQRINAAQELLALGRPDDVAALLAPMLNAAPPLAEAQFWAGWAAYNLDEYERCVTLMSAALAALPEHWWQARVLGFAHFKRGDYQVAADTFSMILEHPPAQPPAQFSVELCRCYYGRGLAELTLGQLQAAREDLARALQLQPSYRQARKAWAELLSAEGRDAEALAAIEALLSDWPTHTDALNLRAQLLTRLGREEEASQALARWREVYDALALIGSLQRSVNQGADTPETWLQSAELFLQLDDLEQALDALERGLNRHPGNLKLQLRLATLKSQR